jgi:predicted ribosome quality control (RQC) complex YloA/Tae2 family protein
VLSLRELERVAGILRREVTGHKIQAVAQPDATSVVLELYGGRDGSGKRRWLRLCCDIERARVSAPGGSPGGSPGSPRFVQYLRAHVRGARVHDVEMLDGERQLALRLRGKEGESTLLLAIFGRKSNVVVLDAEGCIAMTLRSLAETRPELSIGSPWRPPGRSLPQAGEDRFEDVSDAEMLAAIETRYTERERADAEDETRRRLESSLRKEAKGLDRKLEKLGRELANADAASRLEREGELLKSALDRVKRGDSEVVVQDFASGEDVRIALDPKLGPAENLERLFKRYRKGVRALTKAGAQHAAVREARDALSAIEADLVGLADGEALDAFAARPDIARILKKYAPAAPPARSDRPERTQTKLAGRVVPAKYLPRRYRTAGDLEIWVGRSDAANDYLSTRLARGKDLFFHVAATPGSHVILRTEGRVDPPSEAILDACELAAHYSRAKKATRVDVHIVPIANVRKPKGAKPGLVEVHGGRNLHLRREESRLRRVLDARIEE